MFLGLRLELEAGPQQTTVIQQGSARFLHNRISKQEKEKISREQEKGRSKTIKILTNKKKKNAQQEEDKQAGKT